VVTLLSESEKKFDELALGQGDVSDMAAMTEKQEQLKALREATSTRCRL